MGGTFKRWSMKVKQSFRLAPAKQDWVATSNARNDLMIMEVRKFAQQLKALHRDLVSLERMSDTGLGTVRSVLYSHLPRAYDETSVGVVAVDKEERLVGVNVDIESITNAASEMRSRLQQEVLQPLEQWLAAYRTIKKRNLKCEELRLDLDGKRRNFIDLQDRYEKTRMKQGAKERDIEAAYHKQITANDKMNRAQQRFVEAEAEVFNALLTLIRDTAVLREYAAAALAIMQRCFQLSYVAFDLVNPAPMPLLPPPAVPSYTPLSYHPEGVASPTTPYKDMTSASGRVSVATIASMKMNNSPSAYSSNLSPLTSAGNSSPPDAAKAPHTPAGSVPAAPTYVQAHVPSPSQSPEPAAPVGATAAELPPPPAWLQEAKKNAKPPTDEDSDDEQPQVAAGANPFTHS